MARHMECSTQEPAPEHPTHQGAHEVPQQEGALLVHDRADDVRASGFGQVLVLLLFLVTTSSRAPSSAERHA